MSRINNKQTVTTSFPIASILAIVFVVLKLTNNVDWSWWWVLSPLWMPLAIIAILFAVIFILLFVKSVIGLK